MVAKVQLGDLPLTPTPEKESSSKERDVFNRQKALSETSAESPLERGLVAISSDQMDSEEGLKTHLLAIENNVFAGQKDFNLVRHYINFGKEALVLKLIAEGKVDVNAVDQNGNTLLHWACLNGSAKIVLALLEKGANPYTKNRVNKDSLDLAMQRDDSFKREVLYSLDSKKVKDTFGITRVHLASVFGKNVFSEFLANHQDEVDDTDKDGYTFLFLCLNGFVFDVAVELIKAGANLDKVNPKGVTPLQQLVKGLPIKEKIPEEFVKILKDRNVDIEEISRRKFVAHVWAVGGSLMHRNNEFRYDSTRATNFMMEKASAYSQDFIPTSSVATLLNIPKLVEDLEQMPKRLNQSNEEIENDIRTGKLVAFPTGWEGHQTGIIFALVQGSFVILKCNKGQGSGVPGAEMYKIGSFEKLAQVIGMLKAGNSLPKEEGMTFFNRGMHEMLGLEPIGNLAINPQKVGNCGWAAMDVLFLGLLYVNFREKFDESISRSLAHFVYKEYKLYCKLRSLDEYVKESNLPDESLLGQICRKIEISNNPLFANRKEELVKVLTPLILMQADYFDSIQRDNHTVEAPDFLTSPIAAKPVSSATSKPSSTLQDF